MWKLLSTQKLSTNISPYIHPLERELYPARQFWFERWSLNQLRKHGIIASKQEYNLPMELWMLILDLLLHESGISYKYCTHAIFPIYQAHLRSAFLVDKDIRALERDHKSVRLVCHAWCHAWNAIAGQFYEAPMRTPSNRLSPWIKKLAMLSIYDTVALIDRMKDFPNVSSQLTTLVIYANDGPRVDIPLQVLLRTPESYPALRCLFIEGKTGWPSLWETFQKAFPLLISLTLVEKLGFDLTVNLRKLEILDVAWEEGVTYRCPSLRHCSFRHVSYSEAFQDFLDYHGPKLESIILRVPKKSFNDNWRLDSGERFWRSLPNLRTFGITVDYITVDGLKGPPDGHPLTHLRLSFSTYSYPQNPVTVPQVQSILARFAWLRRLYIDRSKFTYQDHATIRSTCQDIRKSDIGDEWHTTRTSTREWAHSYDSRQEHSPSTLTRQRALVLV